MQEKASHIHYDSMNEEKATVTMCTASDADVMYAVVVMNVNGIKTHALDTEG